ncbi:MAG: SpoVA/SpoVAEb family sporulation membrane protein [Ruminococcaceae bacterium]|nr:SpoVA/SpoVAEb family sporulation membrane protein [Oscillospiraceae bacterium]
MSKEIEPIRQIALCPTCTQAEGFILGVGAKMFTIAGPVIVYGVSASVVYGLIYWITTLF